MQPRASAAVLLVALCLGCRTAPVLNVEDATVPPGLAAADVHDAIVSAVPRRGWYVKLDEPGHVVARLDRRDHSATVDIAYMSTSYSITHQESTNLKFDGTHIHKNYNGWVTNLNTDIQTELRAALQRRPRAP